MKIKTRLIIMSAIAAMMLAACEKDHGSMFQGSEAGGSGNGSGKQVVKTTSIDYYKYYTNYRLEYTHGYADGTKYSWTGSNPSRFEYIDYENGTEIAYGGANLTYTYDGDLLKEIKLAYNESVDNVTSYLTYTNGLLTEIYKTYEYSDGSSGWNRLTLNYSDGKIVEMIVLTYGGNTYRTLLTWNGDNVVRKQEYDNDGTLSATHDYTYDNKKAPLVLNPAVQLAFEGTPSSANNVIMETVTYSWGSTNTYSYTYTYDGDYPVKVVENRIDNMYDEGNYTQHTETTYYEYADGTGKDNTPKIYNLSLRRNVDDWGYVNHSGSSQYAVGTTAVIFAYPRSNYEFRQWNDGNTDNPRAITMNADATYTAIFGSSSK